MCFPRNYWEYAKAEEDFEIRLEGDVIITQIPFIL